MQTLRLSYNAKTWKNYLFFLLRLIVESVRLSVGKIFDSVGSCARAFCVSVRAPVRSVFFFCIFIFTGRRSTECRRSVRPKELLCQGFRRILSQDSADCRLVFSSTSSNIFFNSKFSKSSSHQTLSSESSSPSDGVTILRTLFFGFLGHP